MSMFNYSSLAEGDKPVQDLKTKLNNAVGQAIPYVVIGKAKRTSGESVKPIEFGFENGQKVTFMVRQSGDIFRVLLNDKPLPLTSDMTMVQEMSTEIAAKVKAGQSRFDAAAAKAKVRVPTVPRKVLTTKQQLAEVTTQETSIDTEIEKAEQHIEQLKAKLEQRNQDQSAANV